MAIIKGFKNYEINRDGTVINLKNGKELIPYRHRGYSKIKLTNDKGKRIAWRINRLVYEAHLGTIPKGYEIDHIDGDRSNNNLDNLRMVTRQQNIKLKSFRRK